MVKKLRMLFEEHFRLGEDDRFICRMHVEDPDALTIRSPDSFVDLHACYSLDASKVSASSTGGVFDPDQFQTCGIAGAATARTPRSALARRGLPTRAGYPGVVSR
jgi:hypothetical protein